MPVNGQGAGSCVVLQVTVTNLIPAWRGDAVSHTPFNTAAPGLFPRLLKSLSGDLHGLFEVVTLAQGFLDLVEKPLAVVVLIGHQTTLSDREPVARQGSPPAAAPRWRPSCGAPH